MVVLVVGFIEAFLPEVAALTMLYLDLQATIVVVCGVGLIFFGITLV
jgi:hypothetical protein